LREFTLCDCADEFGNFDIYRAAFDAERFLAPEAARRLELRLVGRIAGRHFLEIFARTLGSCSRIGVRSLGRDGFGD